MKRQLIALLLAFPLLASAQSTTKSKGTDNDTQDTGAKKKPDTTPGTTQPGQGTDNSTSDTGGKNTVGVKDKADAGRLGTDNDSKDTGRTRDSKK
jgi:hypothetical protein